MFTTTDDTPGRLAIDGKSPEQILSPENEADCAAILRCAATERLTIVPTGGGTSLQQGNRLRAERWTAVSTGRMTELVDFSPPDMVVTAGAGMTVAALQAGLAQEGQFLALDPPEPDRATIGGIVATNGHGLWRAAYGSPRDRLLGMRVVLADGSIVRAGGKVVKNVAGYDLCKLFAGSWGTLGIICEATFKTNPLPAARSHLCFHAPDVEQAVAAALEVHKRHLQPAYLSVAKHEAVSICVGFMGSRETVHWQENAVSDVLESEGLKRTDAGPTEDDLRHLIVRSTAAIKARINARPTQLPAIAASLPTVCSSVFHVATGVMEVAITGDTPPARETLAQLRSGVPHGGHLVWKWLPAEWKEELDIWGPARGDFGLMRSLKQTLDPHGVFSPGRFIGRL